MNGDTGLLVGGGVALAVSVGATWLVRAASRHLGLVARPNPIVPQHTQPVAHMGGLGVAAGLAAGLAAMAAGSPTPPLDAASLAGFVGGALGFLVVGVLDDLAAVHAATKLTLQAIVAMAAVALGVWAPVTGLDALDRGLAVLWILTVVNACNVTDVCDGLLSGLMLVVLTVMAVGLPGTAPTALACAAACAGFLVFNRPPATIFLGDAGSHLLGFVSATLAAKAAAPAASPAAAILASLLLVGVPMFELLFLTVVRLRKGLPCWKGSPDHFALRLQVAGSSRARVGLVACGANGVCGVGALAVVHVGGLAVPLVGLGAALGAATAARFLLRWEVADSAGGVAAREDDPSAAPALEGARP